MPPEYSAEHPLTGSPPRELCLLRLSALGDCTHVVPIARISKAPVLPFFACRRDDGHYVLTIHPPLEDFPTDDPVADTARVNRIIEQAVMDAPAQYFWSHKRFKKRAGLSAPYKSGRNAR